ncbi:MAG TPA: hypothetical protein VFY47_08055, partial [Thermoleophilaceae bacterium]|nr:hypothetical protein [Thermoleophilaceae bacterium]
MAQKTSSSRSKSTKSRAKSTNSGSKSSNSGSGSRSRSSSRSSSNGNARSASQKKAPSASQKKARSASQKPQKYRFAQNVGGDETMAEQEYRKYASGDDGINADPDVLLAVPVVKVDSIHLEVDDLDARVALKAQVLDLVKL